MTDQSESEGERERERGVKRIIREEKEGEVGMSAPTACQTHSSTTHTHTHTVHKGERDHENPGAVKQGVIWNLELCVCVRVYMCVRVRVYACARERECDLVSFYR